jgi:hypothetical protein
LQIVDLGLKISDFGRSKNLQSQIFQRDSPH